MKQIFKVLTITVATLLPASLSYAGLLIDITTDKYAKLEVEITTPRTGWGSLGTKPLEKWTFTGPEFDEAEGRTTWQVINTYRRYYQIPVLGQSWDSKTLTFNDYTMGRLPIRLSKQKIRTENGLPDVNSVFVEITARVHDCESLLAGSMRTITLFSQNVDLDQNATNVIVVNASGNINGENCPKNIMKRIAPEYIFKHAVKVVQQ